MPAKGVVAPDDQIGPEVALVPEQKLAGGGDVGADPRLPARVEALQLQVGGHEQVDELCVCGGASSTGVDVWCNVVDLLAVLLNDDGATGGPGVGCQHHSVPELDPHDGGAGLFVGDGLDVFAVEQFVSECGGRYLWVRLKSKPPICSA